MGSKKGSAGAIPVPSAIPGDLVPIADEVNRRFGFHGGVIGVMVARKAAIS
jgi:hypothetical protein